MRQLAPLLLLTLAGCYADPAPDRDRGFVTQSFQDQRRILFAADGIQPDPADAAGLTAIARARPGASFALYLPDEGPRAERQAIVERRTEAIRAALLNRPVALAQGGSGAPPRGEARLVITEQIGLPASCLGQPEPWRRPFVPGLGFERRHRLLPAGCASDIALFRQVERPSDLVVGRTMQGGPAGPAARAIERYIYRDEPPVPPNRGPDPVAGQRGENETTSEPRRAGATDDDNTPAR